MREELRQKQKKILSSDHRQLDNNYNLRKSVEF